MSNAAWFAEQTKLEAERPALAALMTLPLDHLVVALYHLEMAQLKAWRERRREEA